MYYGAISTDIRKSSTNWNLFPEWMQKAVNYTNNITEFVFNDTNLFNGIILPNSPEGDAYTFYYRHVYSLPWCVRIGVLTKQDNKEETWKK